MELETKKQVTKSTNETDKKSKIPVKTGGRSTKSETFQKIFLRPRSTQQAQTNSVMIEPRSLPKNRHICNWNLLRHKNKIAHCVSAGLRIGRGIAYQIVEKFPKHSNLKFNGYNFFPTTLLAFYDEYTGVWIYNLVPKQRAHDESQYHQLRHCLAKLRSPVERNQLASVSIPRCACGLEKRDWNTV